MDLVLLRSLLAVADTGTITDAADEIGVSQSALSRRLQQLERDLGAQLLVRGRHGADLTDLGRQAVEQGRSIVARYDQLRQHIVESLDLRRGTVRVGGGATVTSFLLPSAIAEFQAGHPGIRFYVKEAGSREIASDVSAGQLELGVVTLPVADRDLRSLIRGSTTSCSSSDPTIPSRLGGSWHATSRGSPSLLSSRAVRYARLSTAPCGPRAWRWRS